MMTAEKETKQDRQARNVYEGLVKQMLTPIKSMKKPWKSLTEQEQDVFLAQLDDGLRDAIRRAIDLVAADERPNIKVTLKKIEFTSDAVKGQVVMGANDEMRHYLADSAGQVVLLIPIDYEAHMGQRPKGEPQQADLALGAAVDKGMDEAAQAALDEAEKEFAALAAARDEHGCWLALVNVGADWITEEIIATWGLEQITTARAWATACADMGDTGGLPPAMPEFLRQQDEGATA